MDALVRELIEVKRDGAAAVLATVVESRGLEGFGSGAKCLVRDGRIVLGAPPDPELERTRLREAAARLSEERSGLVSVETGSGGQADVFLEVMPSPPKLVVYGLGLWYMKRFALGLAHAYAIYVILNSAMYWRYNPPSGSGETLLAAVYTLIAMTGSAGTAVLLSMRRDELR